MINSIPTNHASSGHGIHFLDCIIVLARNAKTIFFCCLAAMAITYIILFLSPNKYKATARLLPPQQNLTLSARMLESIGGGVTPGIGTGSDLGSMAAGLIGLKSSCDLYITMMRSDTISDRITKRFNLQKLYHTTYAEDIRYLLPKIVKIKSDKDGVITIEAIQKDPKQAAELANVFIEELNWLLQEIAVTEAKGRLAFLEKEHDLATANLTKAEEALRQFSEKNAVVQIDAQTKGMLEYIASLKATIDTKEVQIKVLKQQATPSNYDLIKMETEFNGLKEKLRNAETKWDQSCIGDVCLNTSRVPALGLDYVRLYREVKFREGIYQLYTKMVEIARSDMVKDVAVIQVIDTAKPPERRFNKRVQGTLLSGFVTFLVVVSLLFIREYSHSFKNKEENAQRLTTLALYFQPFTQRLNRLKKIFGFKRRSA